MNEIIIAGILEVDGWIDLAKRVYDPQGIAPALNTMQGGVSILKSPKKETNKCELENSHRKSAGN